MDHDEKYYRAKWMTDDHWECFCMVRDLFYGFHHVDGKPQPATERGIEISTRQTNKFSTYDFDLLTRAVLMAHNRCIRFEVAPSGPRMLKMYLHKRHKRDGSMYERHPTIEQAIDNARDN